MIDTHFGKLIENIVRKSGSDIESEAIRWGYSPNALYKIFKKEDVGTDILKKVSQLYKVRIETLLRSSDQYAVQIGQNLAANDSQVTYSNGNSQKIKELEAKIESLEAQNALLKKMVEILEKKG